MWKNISINKNQIKVDTGKAVLINCPHNSNYDGYSFWHPAKLVRNGKHSAAQSIGYNDEFNFKLIKYGKGKWNSRDIIDEKEIDVEEFEDMFGIVDENIVEHKKIIHTPEEKEKVENNILDELKDE